MELVHDVSQVIFWQFLSLHIITTDRVWRNLLYTQIIIQNGCVIWRCLAKSRGNKSSNVLALGYFNSGLIETLSEKIKNTLLEEIPSKKLGDPSNIASAIEFLIKSDYTNGGVINIDGGM